MFNSFLNTFLEVSETSFPVNYRSIKEKKNSWVTRGLKISFKQKRIQYTLTKKQQRSKGKSILYNVF